MIVGVPVLLVVCVGACWPFTCVMAVGVGVFWWCVFQCRVAVVFLSRRVPGVLAVVGVVGWLVSCVSVVLAWLCVSGVVGVGVCVVCVFWWFRMLTCLASFFFLGSCCLSCLVNNGLPWVWCGGLRVCGVSWLFVVCLVCARVVLLCALLGGWSCLWGGAGGVPWRVIGLLYCLFGACARESCVCVLVLFLVCGVWVCLACVVGVVVWVLGVLLPVVGCLCGLVVWLLRVV